MLVAMSGSIRLASPDAGDVGFGLLDLEEDVFARADADCISALACGRASFSYHRLPEPRLRLTVRKLDASCFDVQIESSAAVWELKAAIEDVFTSLSDDTENAISWQHVWSHFCLCFKEEKLTDDKATLRALGIRDSDELHFSQHLSVEYRPCKSVSKAGSHRRSRTSSLDEFSIGSKTMLDDLTEDDGEKKVADSRRSTSILEEGYCVYQYDEECMEEGRKKGSFFRGWFSYFRLGGNRRTHSEDVMQYSCEKKGSRTGPKFGKWLSLKKSKTMSK